MLGLISNIDISKKVGMSGKQADCATVSQVYGRKIDKFVLGKDMRTGVGLSPCAAAALPPCARLARGSVCACHLTLGIRPLCPVSRPVAMHRNRPAAALSYYSSNRLGHLVSQIHDLDSIRVQDLSQLEILYGVWAG